MNKQQRLKAFTAKAWGSEGKSIRWTDLAEQMGVTKSMAAQAIEQHRQELVTPKKESPRPKSDGGGSLHANWLFVASKEEVDSDGDIVFIKGIDLKDYLR